jgi:hypothetical protein
VSYSVFISEISISNKELGNQDLSSRDEKEKRVFLITDQNIVG